MTMTDEEAQALVRVGITPRQVETAVRDTAALRGLCRTCRVETWQVLALAERWPISYSTTTRQQRE